MIQEIYDYLWIRSFITCYSKEEMITMIDNKGVDYKDFISELSKLMQKEDLLLINDELQDTVSSVVQKYRFDYNKDKNINDDINYIITRLNQYKSMSENRKDYLANKFFEQEYKDRNLPFLYKHYYEGLVDFIKTDCSLFTDIFCDTDSKDSGGMEAIGFISLVNLLNNRYKDFFFEYDGSRYTGVMDNLELLKDVYSESKFFVSTVNKTIKNLRKSEKNKEKVLEF